METKEIKITPPEGYEIDKENSTLECIKFKPVAKKWRYRNPFISGYYISGNHVKLDADYWDNGNYIFATQKQAKSALAMAQISQIMTNDPRFGGVVTDEEWELDTITKYTIDRGNCKICKGIHNFLYSFLVCYLPNKWYPIRYAQQLEVC